jgi:MEMO1 family protein
MSAPNPGTVRRPAVAGMFYPADSQQCRQLAASYVRSSQPQTGAIAAQRSWLGGIVPHAGWICSGAIAGQTIAAIAASQGGSAVDVVVIFGAVHTPLPIARAALDSHRRWQMPGSDVELPQELERKLTESSADLFGVDDRFHAQEHAVEVEVPLVHEAWPSAAVLPVEVPLIDDAIQIGQRTARQVRQANLRPVFLASSDLTHYGVNYGFAPAGLGPQGLAWAKDNDRRLLDLVTAYQVEQVVPEVRQQYNACGGGAIAAMMSACREYAGAAAAGVITHANSYETLASVAPQSPHNAVGYAAVVVG